MRLSLDALISAMVAGFVGLVGAWATFKAGHKQGQASFITAVQEAAHLVIQDLRSECDRLRLAVARAEAAEARTDAQHEACRFELADVRAQIDQLMRERPPADY